MRTPPKTSLEDGFLFVELNRPGKSLVRSMLAATEGYREGMGAACGRRRPSFTRR